MGSIQDTGIKIIVYVEYFHSSTISLHVIVIGPTFTQYWYNFLLTILTS